MISGENKLILAILTGAISGVICGALFGPAMSSVAWIGELFLDALKMLIIPLIAAAVISGVASLGDIRKLGKIGTFTLIYYTSTTAIAVITGLVVVNFIQPGKGIEQLGNKIPDMLSDKQDIGFANIIQSLISPNIIAAAAETQLLPVIVFCLLFAAAMTTIGEKNHMILGFFEGLNEIMMKLVIWLMMLAPVGIFALIAGQIGHAGGIGAIRNELMAVGGYCVTVLLGLGIHAVVLFILLSSFSSYGKAYVISLLRALMTAFGTASSSATLPLTMECAIKAGVDKRSVKFVMPLGATVNMDGTALYEAIAVMFIAQAYNIPLGITEQAIIFLTATLAAIGAASIPQAGLVTMLIVLDAVGLPAEGIGLILAIDWFLDRFRTAVNVWGDSVGTAIIEQHLPVQAN